MSQFPYGYGFQGQPPQQQYPYQPYGAYGAPGYGAQQPQQPQQPPPTTTNSYYATTQSAYDYNANNIPGLGTPSTGSLFPVPFNGPWDQSGYGTNAAPTQYSPYPSHPTPSFPAFHTNKPDETPVFQDPEPPAPFRPQAQAKAQRVERLVEQPREQPKDIDSQEEGEISDGQFDDLYDDASNQPSGPQPLTVASASAKSSEGEVASGTDQEPNFYDTDVDEVPAPNHQSTVALRGKTVEGNQASGQIEPPRTERDRSRSYSPYLSPREIDQDISTPNFPALNVQAGREVQQQQVDSGANAETTARDKQDVGNQSSGAGPGTESEIPSNGSAIALASGPSFKTLPEAQNEAKKTILRLLPLGVKYQTYIDEGMDQKVVKDLFAQLNLAPPAPSPSPAENPAATQEKEPQAPKQPQTELSPMDAKAKKQEERKDKIARLLAEKKAKAAAGGTAEAKASTNPVSTGTSTPSTKPKTQSEKNLLLQQKMQALRAAQEARAQKAGLQTASPQVSRPDVDKDVAQASTEKPTVIAQSAAESKSNIPTQPSSITKTLHSLGPEGSPIQPALQIQSPALPGFSTKPVNQRKRPVAADFVDYPPRAVKRPFPPSRQDSSLIISVSDDEEEEDDDVDMEVDSPTEDSSTSAQQSFSQSRTAPSLRDYPPLTNRGAPRQLSSSAPGTPGGRPANVDLKAQERAIAELKRKIEEAEARAKAKPKTGSSTPQTPSAGDATPIDLGLKPSARRVVSTSETDDKNGPSAQLLQEAEAAKLPKSPALSHANRQSKVERRTRLSSAQIPNMDEKMARIKRMEEELNRLRAEVDESLAEKQRLEEADEPDSDSADDTVHDIQPMQDAAASSGEQDHVESDDSSLDAASQSHPMEIESSDKSDVEMETSPEVLQVDVSEALNDLTTNGPELSAKGPGHVDLIQPPVVEAPVAIPESGKTGDVSGAEETHSDDYEPPDASDDDHTEADSPPFSPAPADNVDSFETSQREAQESIPPMPMSMPTQISTANMPNDDPTTEAHAEFFAHPSSRVEEKTREDVNDSAPTARSSFVDYESPLRYFHAFRFHPNYNVSVQGGFKSLTYSNRIDPKREVCPDELDGQDCSRGSACQFQHFQAMAAPDNLIILELGSSDDLMGDQKKNFNNGLRELVASFQKSKVRDFKTIAEGIVEFRRRFLGDSTKILHLEGVTI